jgi:hypothetical protein
MAETKPTKPDRACLLTICDLAEENGFDPSQVGLLRSWIVERCQPRVKDVVELAMRWQASNPRWNPGLLLDHCDNFLQHASDTMQGNGDDLGTLLAAKLMEMTPERRQMVATRVRDRVAELGREAEREERRYQVTEQSIRRGLSIEQRPTHALYTVTGETLEIIEVGTGPSGVDYVVARNARGEERRFDGPRLRDLRWSERRS